MSDKMRMIMDVGLGSDPMPDLIRVEKNGIRTTFVIEGKAESQLKAKDIEIDELKKLRSSDSVLIDKLEHVISEPAELRDTSNIDTIYLYQEEIAGYKKEIDELGSKLAGCEKTIPRMQKVLEMCENEKGKEIEILAMALDRCADDYDNAMGKIDELKGENKQLRGLDEISAYDIGVFKRMKDELEALRAVIAEGIQVDIAYTGSTNIITNLPNALYGQFILLGLNEVEDNDY